MLTMPETSPRMTAKVPKGFKPVKRLQWAKVVDTPQFAQTPVRVKGAKAKGLRYEKRVQDYLDKAVGDSWASLPGLWMHFEDFRGVSYAQADWVGFNAREGKICIAEIKLSRVARAWWQLNRLYRPLVHHIFPGWDILLVEITSALRVVSAPEDSIIVPSLAHVVPNKTCVMRLPYDC